MSRPEFLKLPFQEQIEYFRSKVPVTTERWDELTDEEYEYAFTIAGLTKADLLVDAKLLVDRAIADGMSLEDFQRQFKRSIGRRGWMEEANKPARTRVIYETNLARSYAAGRYEQQTDPDVLSDRPYWMWRHRTPDPQFGGQPRPEHKALDGKILPADDGFWKVAYPSCAFGCRCGVFSVSEDYMERKGLSVSRFPDPKTIADPGFRKAPGSGTETERKQVVQQKMKTLPPELQAKVREQMRTDSKVRKYKKGKKCGRGYISQDEECQDNKPKRPATKDKMGGIKAALATAAVVGVAAGGAAIAKSRNSGGGAMPVVPNVEDPKKGARERIKKLVSDRRIQVATGVLGAGATIGGVALSLRTGKEMVNPPSPTEETKNKTSIQQTPDLQKDEQNTPVSLESKEASFNGQLEEYKKQWEEVKRKQKEIIKRRDEEEIKQQEIERNKQQEIERNKDKTTATIQKEEKEIIKKDIEHLVAIDPRTGKTLFRVKGERLKVDIPSDKVADCNGAVVTHNHPGTPGAPFSFGDIEAAFELNAGEMRAVSPGYRYSIKPPNADWNSVSFSDIESSYEKHLEDVYIEKLQMIRRGEIKTDEQSLLALHRETQNEILERTAKEMGMEYKVERIPEEDDTTTTSKEADKAFAEYANGTLIVVKERYKRGWIPRAIGLDL